MASSTQYYVSQKQPLRHPFSSRYKTEWPETLSDDSIYIFPNPSSSQGSPTQHSDLSILTDCTSSALTEPKGSPVDDRYDGLVFNRLPLTPLTPLEKIRQIEWMHNDANNILLGIYDRADQWREVIARRRAREPHSELLGASFKRTFSVGNISFTSQQSSFQLPFLTFITSLLSIDDATFQLLSHTSSCSALFPGQTQLSDPGPNGDEGNIELHGVEKLFGPSESRVVIEGCAAVSDLSIPYGPFSLHPFGGLWDIVTDLVLNGSKAVREVFRSP